jgi:hypothetical protein
MFLFSERVSMICAPSDVLPSLCGKKVFVHLTYLVHLQFVHLISFVRLGAYVSQEDIIRPFRWVDLEK